MNVDEINDAQESSLTALRDRIRAKKEQAFEAAINIEPFPTKELQIEPVPEIILPDEAEFSLERYTEIGNALEILYNNYLYHVKKVFDELSMPHHEAFDSALKELCRTQEQLLKEGMKPRF